MDKYMERVYKKYNYKGIVDVGTTTSKEFHEFVSYLKKQMKASAQERGFELVLNAFNRGHYYVSGFFKKEDKYIYFSYDVPRGEYPMDFDARDCSKGVLYRTAKHEKDYTGGSNHFTSIASFMDDVESLFNKM